MGKHRFGTFLVLLVISGCVFSQGPIDSKEMYVKSAQLKKLSGRVASIIRYDNTSSTMTDEAVLNAAMAGAPSVSNSFQDFKVRLNRKINHTVLLVCSADGSQALLEDAECTGMVDAHHWRTAGKMPCEFTIQAATVCVAP